MRLALPAFVAVVALGVCLTGCGGYSASLPDGGRGTVNCAGDMPSVPVTITDKAGLPAPDATVTAVFLSYDNITQSFITNARGVAVLKAQFGPGVVRITGSLNDLTTPAAEVTFAGGECVNAVSPRAVSLQLQ
jgi:hypothetical protein